MTAIKDLKVGDPAVLVDYYNKAHKVKITRVGRKYIAVGHNEFLRETGRSVSQYSYPTLYTVEDHEFRRRVATASQALRSIGVRVEPGPNEARIVFAAHEALRDLIKELCPTTETESAT